MVEDRFDDTGAAITNSGGEIELDLMGGQKSAVPDVGNPLVPPLPPENMDLERDKENSPLWPTDNELEEDETSDVEELRSQETPQFPISGPTPDTAGTGAPKPSAPIFPNNSTGGL